jgi:hypothetical protein
MRTFLDWVATYTVSPPGLVARMALRAPAAFDPEPNVFADAFFVQLRIAVLGLLTQETPTSTGGRRDGHGGDGRQSWHRRRCCTGRTPGVAGSSRRRRCAGGRRAAAGDQRSSAGAPHRQHG